MYRIIAVLLLCCLGCEKEQKTEDEASETAATQSPPPVASTTVSVSTETTTDEFSDETTSNSWERIYLREAWGFDQLQEFDINQTRPGWMTMIPYTSSWYNDYRGILVFKQISGNFMVTTHLTTTNRAASGPPGREYSLAGIMLRSPRNITASTWTSGGENYVFLASGSANRPGTYQTEVKTTLNSRSKLEIDAGWNEVTIRAVRIDAAILLLIKPVGSSTWQVHQRFLRRDLPLTLQVGLTCYTDWQNVESRSVADHNNNLITDGTPDLIAQFDYVRYQDVSLPTDLAGLDLTDTTEVSDEQLLSFLGND